MQQQFFVQSFYSGIFFLRVNLEPYTLTDKRRKIY